MAIDLSCDGRLEVLPFVTERKYLAMAEMVKGMSLGGYAGQRAALDLKESLSSSDAPYSLAHLVNVRNLPDWDKAERQWTKIADVTPVDNFDPQTFYTLRMRIGDNLKYGKGVKTNPVYPVSPKVDEGDTYQYTFGYSEEQVTAAIEKRGFKVGLTLERLISNVAPFVRQLPGDMLEIALDTDEFLVFDALQSNVSGTSQLAAGTAPITGESISATAPFSIPALRLGLHQIGLRQVAQRYVTLAPSYYIVVGQGQAEAANAAIAQARQFQQVRNVNGNNTFIYGAPDMGNLGKIEGVIESPWITSSTAWYAVPSAGTSRRPGLTKMELVGRTAPEVLVNNFTGVLLQGGAGSSPFDLAHFDNDTVDLKLRQFTNATLLDEHQIVWSPGA